jgi:hypothetical protein
MDLIMEAIRSRASIPEELILHFKNQEVMKKNFTYIFFGIVLLISISCDDFIDKKPVDQLTADELFTSAKNAETTVVASYRSLESPYYYGQAFIVVPEFAAGHLRHTASYPEYLEYEENRIRVDNPWSLNMWTAMYATINAANTIIEKAPSIPDGTEALKQQFVREAKFIRALTYFNLVRGWGDVPLVLSSTISAEQEKVDVSRTPSAEVYAQIVEDLTDAVNLPASYANTDQTKGRATQGAAKALLAKVYLYMADYPKAASLAKEVINSSYTLTQDYSSIWITENSSESIFELQFDQQATNSLITGTTWNGTTLFFAKDTDYAMFEEGDRRRDFTLYQTKGNFYVGKYRNDNPATQNLTVIRLSEIYLIYAEAQARVAGTPVGEPYDYYKAIRDRAGLVTADAGTFDVDSFIKAVQHEKRVELMFEGEAWFDYTRTGLALTEMMKVSDPNRYLFPIPQSERNLNAQLSQNSAYQ